MWTTLKFRAKANKQLQEVPRVTQIRIQGYAQKNVVQSAKRIKMTLDILGIKATDVATLPRKRYLFVSPP